VAYRSFDAWPALCYACHQVKAGDTVLLDRPIARCVGGDTFSGAYLDNGLGW
jgi:hypothetical protein